MDAAAAYDLGPLPSKITGGCLCGSLKYEAHFPSNHDFKDNVRLPSPPPPLYFLD